jgi:hypothetical protein
MFLVQDTDRVQTLATEGADQPFAVGFCQGDCGAVITSSIRKLARQR